MPRICHVTPFYCEQYSGTERYVDLISKYQQKMGLNVTILTTTRLRNRVGKKIKNGVEIVRLFSYKNVWNINPISFILPYLIRSEFDLIHIHSYLYFISNQASLIGKMRKTPILLHFHGGVGLPPYQTSILKKTAKAFYDKTLGKHTISAAQRIATVSMCDIQKIRSMNNFSDGNILYLPNAIDLSLFSFKNRVKKDLEKPYTILYVGDIEPWKGIGFLEKWIRKKEGSINHKIKFRFIGQGSYASRIQELEKKSRNGNITVEFYGEQPHKMIPKFLAEVQALILPSYWEGLPTVVLEAMAADVPVLTTPVGDIPHFIKHGENGLIFNHDFKSLDNAINILLENPIQQKKIRKNAYRTVLKNFNGEIIHKKIMKVYKTMLKHD